MSWPVYIQMLLVTHVCRAAGLFTPSPEDGVLRPSISLSGTRATSVFFYDSDWKRLGPMASGCTQLSPSLSLALSVDMAYDLEVRSELAGGPWRKEFLRSSGPSPAGWRGQCPRPCSR